MTEYQTDFMGNKWAMPSRTQLSGPYKTKPNSSVMRFMPPDAGFALFADGNQFRITAWGVTRTERYAAKEIYLDFAIPFDYFAQGKLENFNAWEDFQATDLNGNCYLLKVLDISDLEDDFSRAERILRATVQILGGPKRLEDMRRPDPFEEELAKRKTAQFQAQMLELDTEALKQLTGPGTEYQRELKELQVRMEVAMGIKNVLDYPPKPKPEPLSDFDFPVDHFESREW